MKLRWFHLQRERHLEFGRLGDGAVLLALVIVANTSKHVNQLSRDFSLHKDLQTSFFCHVYFLDQPREVFDRIIGNTLLGAVLVLLQGETSPKRKIWSIKIMFSACSSVRRSPSHFYRIVRCGVRRKVGHGLANFTKAPKQFVHSFSFLSLSNRTELKFQWKVGNNSIEVAVVLFIFLLVAAEQAEGRGDDDAAAARVPDHPS